MEKNRKNYKKKHMKTKQNLKNTLKQKTFKKTCETAAQENKRQMSITFSCAARWQRGRAPQACRGEGARRYALRKTI